ncbi:hypothetical protein PANT111_130346 [Pantoea brenneri]|uniref:Uncharacterized protein n=1 Tax=Pantoea brenneri TaxID=472694 RepID=A0AAX3J2B8_9GAMM|nr:hypothetical protein PANT111_130346 [Pantoea brenneri]
MNIPEGAEYEVSHLQWLMALPRIRQHENHQPGLHGGHYRRNVTRLSIGKR